MDKSDKSKGGMPALSERQTLKTVLTDIFAVDSSRVSVHTLNDRAELEDFANDWRGANQAGVSLQDFASKTKR